MTDKEQIIINGVDISECEFLNASVFSGNSYWCNLFHNFCSAADYNYNYIHCFDKCPVYQLNKQLARKTQECEQKEKELLSNEKIINKLMKEVDELKRECEGLKNIVLYWEQTDKIQEDKLDRYRKALEEIEEYVRDNSDFDKSDILTSKTGAYDILDIINKAKGLQ